MLSRLVEQEGKLTNTTSQLRRELGRLSTELYHFVCFFALLLGVLFAGVSRSQRNRITCDNSWGPATVVVVITGASIAHLIDNFGKVKESKEKISVCCQRLHNVFKAIDTLRFLGAAAYLNVVHEEVELAMEATLHHVDRRSKVTKVSVSNILVLLFMILLSGLTLVSCHQMICSNA